MVRFTALQRAIDRQSVKTTAVGSPERGFDGGKKVNGRKRHLLVDTLGLVIAVLVHAANIPDREGGKLLLDGIPKRFPRVRTRWTDSGYNGSFRGWATTHVSEWDVALVRHWWTGLRGFWVAPGQQQPAIPQGFHILPRRWVVERTLAWLDQYRRLSKDYERLPKTSETLVYVAMSRLMLRRLARQLSIKVIERMRMLFRKPLIMRYAFDCDRSFYRAKSTEYDHPCVCRHRESVAFHAATRVVQ